MIRVMMAVLVSVLAVHESAAQQLSGRVEWKTKGNAAPAQAVVYAEPIDRAASAAPGKAALQHRNKTFLPHVIAVPVGSTVTFPNEDPIFHNAFSLSQAEPFDMGLYRGGDSKQRVFTKPGAYHVFCNIHPQMAAFLVVSPTPYVTVAAADGSWRLDLPAGKYRLTALSERASPVTTEVSVGGASAATAALVLDESGFVAAPHLNKYGKPYAKDAYKGQ